jgi:type II secretory pathway component PulF
MNSRKPYFSFYRQLAILLKAGFTLLRSLDLLTRSAATRGIAPVVRRLIERIERGSSFWEALGQDPGHFPELEVQLVRAGEESGQLPDVLQRLAAAGMQELAFRGRLKAAAAYPCLIAAASIGMVVFLSAVVLPVFVDSFRQQHLPLPAVARVVLAAGDAVTQHGLVLALVVVAVGLLIRLVVAVPKVRHAWDGLKLRSTWFGPLTKEYVVVRTCGTLAMLLESGVNLLRALELVRDGAVNRVVARTLNEMREEVTAGRDLTAPLRGRAILPAMVVDLIATGEAAGCLPESLQHASEIYQEELNHKLQLLENLTEPALLLAAGLVVMVVVFSVFLTYIHLVHVMAAGGS